MEMTGPWKGRKTKSRFSALPHRPLEISPTPRDFHIPTASPIYPPRRKIGGSRRTGGYGKVEIQNQDSHFPTAANRLRRKV
jgi:hypothetical protein